MTAATNKPGPIFGREPAFWIGLAVTLVSGALATLLGQGVITDVQAGRITDLVDGLAKLFVAIAPLIATLLTRQVVTPIASPSLPVGTAVTTPTGAPAVVSGASPTHTAPGGA